MQWACFTIILYGTHYVDHIPKKQIYWQKCFSKLFCLIFVNDNEGEAKIANLMILIETLWSTNNCFEETAWSF